MKERVKELRMKLGYTLDEFGERIGIKKAGLCAIEHGRVELTPRNVSIICREFHVSEAWLTTGEGSMFEDGYDVDASDDVYAKRVKALRVALKKTQEQFADELGLTKNFISLVENGSRKFSSRSIKCLCMMYGVNETWLMSGNGSMFLDESDTVKTGMPVVDASDSCLAELLGIISKMDTRQVTLMIEMAKILENYARESKNNEG